MTISADQHPLTKTQHTAACTIIALFWGIGVTLIDQHPEVGISLSLLGIAITLWMYGRDFSNIKIARVKEWPWIGIIIMSIEIVVPGYLFYITHHVGIYPGIGNTESVSGEAVSPLNTSSQTPADKKGSSADCHPGAFACIRASGGGVVDGIHFYDTKSCLPGPFLDVKGDGGVINDITSDRYASLCKEDSKIENKGASIKRGSKE
ncbi:hypothetical protein FM996_11360 [Methylosinus sporium]|uniref:Uncharacterized protein n=1 Tax=Methylosinus sporium TaxID=428 RepID=A0A549STY3_METSR|nr:MULTISPECIES: hypothetical protein [Methylosinus]MBU3889103.1 hypothetical protein [Methylosinus sp. KRF6]TRL33075.1 hypothetical protein FM996_11360 [Methylosinus sporium]